jgi:type II secretory pathway component PulJ
MTSRGFTLLEAVLALTLAVGIVGGMMALYQQAVSLRQKVNNQTEILTSERILMDRMTQEMRSAVVYPFLGFGMEGAADSAAFITTTVPGPAAWVVRKGTEDALPPETDLQLVTYRMRTYEDDYGMLQVSGIERSCQKILSSPTAQEGAEISTVLLTPYIQHLQFQFFDGTTWTNVWRDKGLPLAVEITMGFEPLPEDTEPQDYPYPVFRRIVHLPGATTSLQGPIIRGLGGRKGGAP